MENKEKINFVGADSSLYKNEYIIKNFHDFIKLCINPYQHKWYGNIWFQIGNFTIPFSDKGFNTLIEFMDSFKFNRPCSQNIQRMTRTKYSYECLINIYLVIMENIIEGVEILKSSPLFRTVAKILLQNNPMPLDYVGKLKKQPELTIEALLIDLIFSVIFLSDNEDCFFTINCKKIGLSIYICGFADKIQCDNYTMRLNESITLSRKRCIVCNVHAKKSCDTCRQSYYCSKTCQSKHLSEHMKVCKSKDKNLNECVSSSVFPEKLYSKEIINYCNLCTKPSKFNCGKCKKTFYCSKECQVKDWNEHKKKCIKFN